jgi:uncharacterized protein
LPQSPLRLVIDTNVLLSGLVSRTSAARRIVDALQTRKLIPLVSPAVMSEYRAVLLHPDILSRFSELTPKRVISALHRLRYVADEFDSHTVKFELPRDPNDAMFVELAIAGSATHVVTLDADLLSLPTSRTDAGKRFRQRLRNTAILRPADFIAQNQPFFESES